jgi:hypothetical protein
MARKYINDATEELLTHCYPGLIPARVIEEALREKAAREGRLTHTPAHGTRPLTTEEKAALQAANLPTGTRITQTVLDRAIRAHQRRRRTDTRDGTRP